MAWLADHGVDYVFINTKEESPTPTQLSDWVNQLGAKSMRNTSGKSYRALGEERNRWTEEQWVDAFSKDAMLLKRPLFVKDGTAVLVGFKASDAILQEKLMGG